MTESNDEMDTRVTAASRVIVLTTASIAKIRQIASNLAKGGKSVVTIHARTILTIESLTADRVHMTMYWMTEGPGTIGHRVLVCPMRASLT